MAFNILAFSVEYLVRCAFLLLALWLLIKIQRLQCKFLGLLGSAALATGLDMIPLVGHYLAVPGLLFCLIKATREDYINVAFTVGISYALVFGMNLFLLGSLLGDLRWSARMPHKHEAEPPAEQPPTTTPGQAAKPQKIFLPVMNAPPVVEAKKPAVASGFALKGISTGASNATAIVYTGVKTYTIALGETFPMDTVNGRVNVSLRRIAEGSATLIVAGEPVELHR